MKYYDNKAIFMTNVLVFFCLIEVFWGSQLYWSIKSKQNVIS